MGNSALDISSADTGVLQLLWPYPATNEWTPEAVPEVIQGHVYTGMHQTATAPFSPIPLRVYLSAKDLQGSSMPAWPSSFYRWGAQSPGNQTTCTKPLSNGDFTAAPRCLPHHCEKQRLLKTWQQVQDSHQKQCEKWACFGPTDILQVCLGHGFQSMLHGASRGLGVFSGPGKAIRHKGKNPVSSHPDVN